MGGITIRRRVKMLIYLSLAVLNIGLAVFVHSQVDWLNWIVAGYCLGLAFVSKVR